MNRGAKSDGRGPSPAVMYNTRPRSNPPVNDDESAQARRKLEALFGGTVPSNSGSGHPGFREAPTRAVFASPRKTMGGRRSLYREKLDRLRAARELKDIQEASNAFLAQHQLPDDMEILLKVLQHSDEKILCNVMGHISFLIGQKRARANIILTDRLNELSSRDLSQSTKSCLDGLRSQISRIEAMRQAQQAL